MNEIFISYRREDSEVVTGRIYDHLAEKFGNEQVFKDVDSISIGDDFRSEIHSAIELTRCVLVIIGERWLKSSDNGVRRIDSPDDYVRGEIEAALGRKIPLIPVLVNGAVMPPADSLPSEIREMAFRKAISIRSDPDFRTDMSHLAKRIDQVCKLRATDSSRRILLLSGIGLGMGLMALPAYYLWPRRSVLVVGIKQWIGYTPLAVAQERNLFPDDIEVVFKHVLTAADVPSWISDGTIQIGFWTIGDHVNHAEDYKSKPDDVNRPVAILKVDTSRGADGIVARQEIKTVADLAGKEFLFQPDDVSDFMLQRYCKKHDLRYDEIVGKGIFETPEVAPLVFKNRSDLLAVGTYEPHISRLLDPNDQEYYVPGAWLMIESGHESVVDSIVDIAVTRHNFVEHNKAALKSFFTGWFRAVELLNNNDQNAVDIARKFNAPPPFGSGWTPEGWPTYEKISIEDYQNKISGLREKNEDGSIRTDSPTWPDLAENKSFFSVLGVSNQRNMFRVAFTEWSSFLRKKSNLDPEDFESSAAVLELPDDLK